LSDALLRLLGDTALRAEIGENQRKLIAEHFAMDVVVDAHRALYERAISGR
jgi:glycosyltransferase involved in cell wall biosynthesis